VPDSSAWGRASLTFAMAARSAFLVPVHDTTARALREYLRLRDGLCPDATTRAVLISPAGTRLLYCNVHATWKKVAASAELRPRTGSCRPRMHDYADRWIMPSVSRRAWST
jgi:integrase